MDATVTYPVGTDIVTVMRGMVPGVEYVKTACCSTVDDLSGVA